MKVRITLAALILALALASPAGAQVQGFAPDVQKLTVTPRAFKALAKGSPVVIKGGATVSFRIDIGSTVDFSVRALLPGKRSSRGCVPGAPKSKKRRCTRTVPVPGSFAFVGIAGSNDFRFSGRIGDTTLKSGAYKLIAKARGQAARSSSARFRITG